MLLVQKERCMANTQLQFHFHMEEVCNHKHLGAHIIKQHGLIAIVEHP